MDSKIKHLEFAQATINRMATNSFLIKGWSVTLVVGLLAVSHKELDKHYIYISLAVLILFWLLDGYYLSRERRFINLFDHIRNTPETQIDFSMDPQPYGHRCNWFVCAFSRTILIFYGAFLATQLVLFSLL